jgi:hypothetical protein
MNWSKDSGQDAAPPPKRDARFHGRSKILCPVTLAWQDGKGSTHTIRGRGLDMSGAGACVESAEAVTPGAYAVIQVPKLKLMGSAIVKHCGRHGSKYRIGLEFRNPLTKSF